MRVIFGLVLYAQCLLMFFNVCSEGVLPMGFVFLRDVAPEIVQSPRYYSDENFTGKRVPGYERDEVILSCEAAQALKKVAELVAVDGYLVVVYDGYRPQRAVNSFIDWSKDINDQIKKSDYYPFINKGDIFELGYVARRSGHSRGSTVDLTLIRIGDYLYPVKKRMIILSDGSIISFLYDGTVFMGSSFDMCHPVSHHDTDLVSTESTEMRNYLRDKMEACGFRPYAKEWWHYTLNNEPFPDTYFDFVPSGE
jgi:zinc D-Ala-D-Ala dipeptidase